MNHSKTSRTSFSEKSKKFKKSVKDPKNHVCNQNIKRSRTDIFEWFTPRHKAQYYEIKRFHFFIRHFSNCFPLHCIALAACLDPHLINSPLNVYQYSDVKLQPKDVYNNELTRHQLLISIPSDGLLLKPVVSRSTGEKLLQLTSILFCDDDTDLIIIAWFLIVDCFNSSIRRRVIMIFWVVVCVLARVSSTQI